MKTLVSIVVAVAVISEVNSGFIRQPLLLQGAGTALEVGIQHFPQAHECPRIPRGSIGICIDNCVSDGQCQGLEKCCSNGCARRCTGMERVRGECPAAPDIPLSTCSNCPNCACQMDSQCRLGQKCCQSSCGYSICI